RLIIWMMAREYYDQPGVRWFCSKVRAIPVERSGRDMAATRAALRTLKDGGVLGVFPEGRIEVSRELLPFQVGVGLLAIKSGVPVVPAYLEGTQRGKEMLEAIFTPNVTELRFGSPLHFDRHGADPEQATAQIQSAVETLRRQTR